MDKIRTAVIIYMIFMLASWSMPGLVMAEEIFSHQLMMPKGLATTPFGDVLIHSTIISTTFLTLFAPDGSVRDQARLGSNPIEAALLEGAHLAADPDNNVQVFYLLAPAGVLLVLDDTLQEITRTDLRALPTDTTNVYDTSNGLASNNLTLSEPIFGDLDVFIPRTNASERVVLCAGISNGIPFVLRFRTPSVVLEPTMPKVVLMSTVAAPIRFNAPRGVAVAKDTGMALTTLPIGAPAPLACPDAVIKFSIFDPERTAEVLNDPDNVGIPSWGMTTDTQNNFYLTTTGSMEDPACRRRGSAGVVLVPSGLTGFGNSFQSSSFSRPEDVAVSPATHDIYITFTEDNTVARFPPLAPVAP